MWSIFYRFASPKSFYSLAGQLLPWFAWPCFFLFAYGLIGGLVLAPADYQQGEGFRIIYVHVPAAFLSLMIYSGMAIAAGISLIWRIKLADIVVKQSAPIGAMFTFLALVTGSIWGKPMWGTWWIWDARLTSELILLFLYMGVIGLQSAIEDYNTAARAGNILVLVGAVDIPIIHYSVTWWNTLHQGPSLSRFAKPAIAADMLWPLLSMIAAFVLYYLVVLLLRTRCEVLQRERNTEWVKNLV